MREMVASQLLNSIGLCWIGVAAKLGPANINAFLSCCRYNGHPGPVSQAHNTGDRA